MPSDTPDLAAKLDALRIPAPLTMADLVLADLHAKLQDALAVDAALAKEIG